MGLLLRPHPDINFRIYFFFSRFFSICTSNQLAMACDGLQGAQGCTIVYPPQAASPLLTPCPTGSIGGPRRLGPSRSVFLGRFFLPKPATRSKFTLEFTLETRLLGKLSVVPVLGVRYQVLGNSTGENIHNLKSIYLYKRVLLYLVLNHVRANGYRRSSANKKKRRINR